MAKTPTTAAWSSSRAHSTCSSSGPCSGGRSTATASARPSARSRTTSCRIETGSLYPALHRLEKRGWLKSEWGVSEANQRAKYYRLTAAGKAQLVARAGSLVAARARDRPHHEPGARRARSKPMRPDERDLDDEIRGHIALSVKERIERGEDPEAARLAALREFGYVPAIRDSMRARLVHPLVRRRSPRSGRTCASAMRSLRRAKGSGRHGRRHARARHRRQRRHLQRRPRRAAAAARQSRRRPPDLHPPERAGPRRREHDVLGARDRRPARSRATTDRRLRRVLDASTSRMIGFGEPRVVRAGVVDGSYFEVMGLRPVLGRLLGAGGRRRRRGRCRRADASLLDHVAQQRSRRSSARRSGSARAPPPSSACSSRPCRIRPTPRSSRTW